MCLLFDELKVLFKFILGNRTVQKDMSQFMRGIELSARKRLLIVGQKNVRSTILTPTAQTIEPVRFHLLCSYNNTDAFGEAHHIQHGAETESPMLTGLLGDSLNILFTKGLETSTA